MPKTKLPTPSPTAGLPMPPTKLPLSWPSAVLSKPKTKLPTLLPSAVLPRPKTTLPQFSPPRALSPKDVEQAKALVKDGTDLEEVAKQFNVSRATIYRYVLEGNT